MAQSKSDITIPVNGLTDLMEQLSNYEKDTTGRACVTVLDVYCSTWGACNVLKSTFKDISIQEVDDQTVSLKFCQVNASQVLQDLKARTSTEPPLSPRSAKRPVELQRDILPEAWKDKFQEQLGKAKPLFLFYKDCQYINSIEGVNTPYIKKTIKQLIKEKKPASEFITNVDLLELWSDQFGALESEVPWQKFCKAINVWCLFPPTAPPLNDEESKVLLTALNVEKGSMPMVTAKGLQDFVGDSKFESKFHEILPGYETRISEERARREKEEKEGAAAPPPPEPEPEPKKEEAAEEPAKEEPPAPPAPPAVPTLKDFTDGAVTLGEIEPVNVGTAESLELVGSFTLSTWFSVAEGASYEERDNDDFGIFGCGETGKENGYLYLAIRKQKVVFSFNGEAVLSSENEVAEAEWTHVSVTYSADTKEGTLHLGSADPQKATFAEDTALSPESQAIIGNLRYSGESCSSAFIGRVAGFKIANTVLSAEEIGALAEDKSLCTEEPPKGEGNPSSPPAEPKPEGEANLNETGGSYTDEPQSPDGAPKDGADAGEGNAAATPSEPQQEGENPPPAEPNAEGGEDAEKADKPAEEKPATEGEDTKPAEEAEQPKEDTPPPAESEEKKTTDEGEAPPPPAEDEKPAEPEAPAEEPAPKEEEKKEEGEAPPAPAETADDKPAEEEKKEEDTAPSGDPPATETAADPPKEEEKKEEEAPAESPPAEDPKPDEPPAEAPAGDAPKEEQTDPAPAE
eukprot:TRINITY_DN18384_c0_g1_i1.p1 TRINITY_DN18384_c0_g1~~TRINITY_DN18384_c0_g1_i1.p1  ORF type:complete len:743 (+),score=216.94 TRINITY_DN18384_c0_g1_i1:58-2286(+)